MFPCSHFRKMPRKLLIITDSQGRGIPNSASLSCRFRPGGKAHHARELIDEQDISPHEDVAIWLGGNNAHPRSGSLVPSTFKEDIRYAVICIRDCNPRANIVLVAATRRGNPAKNSKIGTINAIIRTVAFEENVPYANVYRSLDRHYTQHSLYLKKRDGVHLTLEAKMAVVSSIRHQLGTRLVPALPTPIPLPPLMVAGKNNTLSMFFPSPIIYRYGWFRTAEHAYQHEKCTQLNLLYQADRIKAAPSPGEAKHLGRIATSLMSPETRQLILESILAERWRSQPAFRAALIATGTRYIAHPVPDTYWGHLEGAGQNMYGKALMKTRHTLPRI